MSDARAHATAASTPAARGPGIRFERVGLQLGGTRVLEAVDFHVVPGRLHALIGPNGGGKTSLMRCLLGQLPHTGHVRLDWPGTRPGRIGYVPQFLRFDQSLPLSLNDFMAIVHQRRPAFLGLRRRTSIERVLERVGLAEKRHRLLGQLSGGELQRLLLAQALLPEPDLLLLDEPASGMDKAGALVLERVLHELRDAGLTILWIHHDLRHVREHADTVTCVHRRVMFTGSPADVLTPERILEVFSAPAASVERDEGQHADRL